ncbi:MAG: hypothetical protein HZC41_24855 [Chloroflexi bacterium]|nr:hypothetical protein [Chloroflexota bacterium]
MSLGRSPRRSGGRGGPPAWLIFLVGVAIVFGVYYIGLGVQNFLRTGGRGVLEITQQAQIAFTATAGQARPTSSRPMLPTSTPAPTCTDFVVSVPNAIVRQNPAPNAAIVTSYLQGQAVCVLGRAAPESEWYLIDQNPRTRRIEAAYMHETVVEAVNPTVTPTRTPTYTRTPTPTDTPSATPRPPVRPTATPNPDATDTPPPTDTPTMTPSPTLPRTSI